MKATMIRAIPAALAVLAITAGAATAAVAMSDRAPADADASIEPEADDDRGRPGDDLGTPDEGTDDGRCSHPDDHRPGSTIEDRSPRNDVRHDRDRREARAEARLVGSHTYLVAQAGSVTVERQDDTLTVTDVVPSLDWTPYVERSSGYEVEVTFRRDGQRVDFKAESEHDSVKTRIRER